MRALLLVVPLALTSCSAFGGGEAVVEVDYTFRTAAAADGLEFGATVDVGGRPVTLARADFRPVGDRQFDATPLAVGDGPARVTCLAGRGGAAEVSVQFRVEDDHLYRVTCAVSDVDPVRLCFGCRGSEAAPLDPALGFAPGDSLFAVWGGDPVDDPPIYWAVGRGPSPTSE